MAGYGAACTPPFLSAESRSTAASGITLVAGVFAPDPWQTGIDSGAVRPRIFAPIITWGRGKNGTTCLLVSPELPQDSFFHSAIRPAVTHCDRDCRAKPVLRGMSTGAQAETPRQEQGRKAIAGIAAGDVCVDPAAALDSAARYRSGGLRYSPLASAAAWCVRSIPWPQPLIGAATVPAMPFNGHRSATYRFRSRRRSCAVVPQPPQKRVSRNWCAMRYRASSNGLSWQDPAANHRGMTSSITGIVTFPFKRGI